MQGIAELSNPSVKYRLDQATEFPAVLVEGLLAAKIPGAELRWSDRTLRLADGACVPIRARSALAIAITPKRRCCGVSGRDTNPTGSSVSR